MVKIITAPVALSTVFRTSINIRLAHTAPIVKLLPLVYMAFLRQRPLHDDGAVGAVFPSGYGSQDDDEQDEA